MTDLASRARTLTELHALRALDVAIEREARIGRAVVHQDGRTGGNAPLKDLHYAAIVGHDSMLDHGSSSS